MNDRGLILTAEDVTTTAALVMPNKRALTSRIAAIESIITDLFTKGTHYGEPFPGSDRMSLLQPGAEIVVAAFGLSPDPKVTEIDEGGGHRTYLCEGSLTSSGVPVGFMSSTCTTMESKYRWRKGGRVCPACGCEGSIIKSKFDDCEWFCFQKKGGCGEKFKKGDAAIEDQTTDRVENKDPADVYHTARMMSQKRWLVAITRRTFALSARFVDAEGYGKALFDWEGKGADLLRALPGKRKWAMVGQYTLATFGKEPKRINNVEGAVVMDWLRETGGVPVAADDAPPDTSPSQPPKGAQKGPSPLERELAAPDDPPEPLAAPPDADEPSPLTPDDLDVALKFSEFNLSDVGDIMDPPLELSVKSARAVPADRRVEFLAALRRLSEGGES